MSAAPELASILEKLEPTERAIVQAQLALVPPIDPQVEPAPVDAETFAEMLRARRTRRLSRQREPYARRNAIASDLGDCDRAIALAQLAYEVRPAIGPEARERMESGEEQERAVVRQLLDEGWEIVEQQARFEIKSKDQKRVILSGKIDLRIALSRRQRVVVEVKDTSDANFRRWHSADDLRLDRWARKWWRQFQAYLLGHGEEWGILLLCHRGQRRPIVIELDYDAAEHELARLERNDEVTRELAGTALEDLDGSLSAAGLRYPRDLSACAYCDFRHRVCQPPDPSSNALADLEIADEPVQRLVSRFQQLASTMREAQSLYRRIEKIAPAGKHVHAGEWIVTGATYTVNLKAQPAKPAKPAEVQQRWRREFVRASELSGPPLAEPADAESSVGAV
jgi:Holliday junction resolvase-like predicted endonuclease